MFIQEGTFAEVCYDMNSIEKLEQARKEEARDAERGIRSK